MQGIPAAIWMFGPNWIRSEISLSTRECDRLIEIVSSAESDNKHGRGGGRLRRRRAGRRHKLTLTPQSAWMYDVLYQVVTDANRERFRLLLSGIERAPEYVEQTAGSRPLRWRRDYRHRDIHDSCKLTVICQLSDPSAYRGGDLQIFDDGIATTVPARGGFFVLLGALFWRVTPVTRGVRRSLVSWFAGPRMR
ncbi:MAG: 2OG-Fe(II) oxygenase [Hyphomicrobiales bacterium]|nr:2OG-Fe(II) oxygenase [Hyphomicrobiales bacterium]MBV8823449.1 2OG-Fe(II) oxygenase [Hyphomicrobiales bacterium]